MGVRSSITNKKISRAEWNAFTKINICPDDGPYNLQKVWKINNISDSFQGQWELVKWKKFVYTSI